ncbi:hypothetical protein BH09PLA1_BH09PLA1_25140 [soil metagenome]
MSNAAIAVPDFVNRLLRERNICRHCRLRMTDAEVITAGITRVPDGSTVFMFEAICPKCGKRSISKMIYHHLHPKWWAEQISAWIVSSQTSRALSQARSSRPSADTQAHKRVRDDDSHGDEEGERPEYRAAKTRVMEVTAGNYDHAEGERAIVVTIARGHYIQPLVFPIDDAKQLVAQALVALATYDDVFAQRLLDDNFAADANDDFIGPPT